MRQKREKIVVWRWKASLVIIFLIFVFGGSFYEHFMGLGQLYEVLETKEACTTSSWYEIVPHDVIKSNFERILIFQERSTIFKRIPLLVN